MKFTFTLLYIMKDPAWYKTVLPPLPALSCETDVNITY